MSVALKMRRSRTAATDFMIKLLLILLVGLTFESTGVVLLKKGMTHIGDMNGYTAAEILRVVKAGATNPQILLGVFFEALAQKD